MSKASKPGYQGSETSGADLHIYPQSGDAVVVRSKAKLDWDGRRPGADVGMLLGVQTAKAMGAASGTWSAQIKPYPGNESLFNRLVDDDWIDIVWRRHGRPWHTMRGLIDDVRRVRNVSGTGATSTVYQLTGRDFGKVFESIPIWFSQFTDQIVLGAAAYRTIDGAVNTIASPDEAVRTFLFDMIRALQNPDTGRATWKIPDSAPRGGGRYFVDAVLLDTLDYQAYPERQAVGLSWMNLQGISWALASEYSDPAFCELYCDTLPPRTNPPDQECDIAVNNMVVVLRTRPFPLASTEIIGERKGDRSAYFDLPLHVIPRQHLGADDLGRSGYERFNAFFHAPQLTQDALKNAIDLWGPLWNTDEIARHGLRRFDVTSRYTWDVNKINAATYMEQQRYRIRDWHCLNPYYLSGTINLLRGHPEIRIGDRVRVPGNTPDLDETFYVESVTHAWQFGQSIKTSLGVTHGWVGSDFGHLTAIREMAALYEVAQFLGTSS